MATKLLFIMGFIYSVTVILSMLAKAAKERDRLTYERFKEDVKPDVDFDDLEESYKDWYSG